MKLRVLKLLLLLLMVLGFSAYLSYGAWQAPSRPLVSSFNTSFWDVPPAFPPLDAEVAYIGENTVDGVPLEQYNITFNSHYFNGSIITIHAVVVKPSAESQGLPGILVMHGTGGSYSQMLPFGLQVASKGYAVMMMDSPGCGQSTGPGSSPENTVNFSEGPYSAYYYHNVLAASRAITVLSSLPYVNGSAIAASGASMGGVTTFILAAVDDRVRAAIPVVASGYFDEIAQEGSLANFIIPQGVKASDPEALDLIRYFDCRAYAQQLEVPTLMLVGTNDEFFFLEAVNKTYSLIPSEKAIALAPNHGHFSVADGWISSAVAWLDQNLKGRGELPTPPTPTAEVINFYTGLRVVTEGGQPLPANTTVFYRYGLPGSPWVESPGGFIPLLPLPNDVQYFIAVKEGGSIASTSQVFDARAQSSLFAVALLFIIALAILLAFNWRDDLRELISSDRTSFILFAGSLLIWLVAAYATSAPWIEFAGRSSVSLLELWDRYALHLPSFYLVFAALLAALAGYAVRMWAGGIILAAVALPAYYYLATLLPQAIVISWGAYLLGACVGASLVVPAVLKIVRG